MPTVGRAKLAPCPSLHTMGEATMKGMEQKKNDKKKPLKTPKEKKAEKAAKKAARS
jgi:hypothetical protein